MTVHVVADTASIDAPDVGNVTELVGIQRQLAADFFVYRTIISEELLKSDPPRKLTEDVMKEMHTNLEEYWREVFNPTIRAGYIRGNTRLDNEVAEAAVGKYSGVLADQINSVSDKAFLEGYHAALNKGWEKAVAWQRIADAYGLDPAQMRQWVSYYPTEGYHPEELPKKSKEQLDKMLMDRAQRIGDNEGRTIANLGKQMEWESQHVKGDIPDQAKKVWRTAKDELVCSVCAPMDAIAIPVNEQFVTANGKFFVPPVHINCRCSIYILRAEDDVVKRMGNDRYNRDRNGRFARVEGRNLSRRTSAFGVSQLPPKEKVKTKEEIEREKLYALPLAGIAVPLAMQQKMSKPISEKAIELDNKKIKDSRDKKKKLVEALTAKNRKPEQDNQNDNITRNESPLFLEGVYPQYDKNQPDKAGDVLGMSIGDMIKGDYLNPEPVSGEAGNPDFFVVLPPGCAVLDKDGNVSTETTSRLFETFNPSVSRTEKYKEMTNGFWNDVGFDPRGATGVDEYRDDIARVINAESMSAAGDIGSRTTPIHIFKPEDSFDDVEDRGGLRYEG